MSKKHGTKNKDQVRLLKEENQRLTDLVRYARLYLSDEGLITDEEYAALVIDADSGQRVARIESWDGVKRNEAVLLDLRINESLAVPLRDYRAIVKSLQSTPEKEIGNHLQAIIGCLHYIYRCNLHDDSPEEPTMSRVKEALRIASHTWPYILLSHEDR